MPSTALPPSGLMVDLIRDPERTPIPGTAPRFTWIVRDAAADEAQTGYQILAARHLDDLVAGRGDLWDSGKVGSDDTWRAADLRPEANLHVPWGGAPLAPGDGFWWQVRTWNRRNQPSPWSEPQRVRLAAAGAPALPRCPLEATAVAPEQVVQTGPQRWFVAFPRAAFATLRLELPPGTPSACVRLHLGERCAGWRVWSPEDGGLHGGQHIASHRLEMAVGPGACTVALPTRPSPGALPPPAGIAGVIPFRYAEIDGCPRPLLRAQVRQLAVHHPFDTGAAAFASADPGLDRVWEVSRYTMQATSAFGVYVDGERERLPYEADAYINQLGHYCCDREYSLARFTTDHLIDHPTWPVEWILHSVFMAWEDYRYTGDDRLLRARADDLAPKTLHDLADADGLISSAPGRVTRDLLAAIHLGAGHPVGEKGFRDIVDWPPCERDGFDLRPVNTVTNALHHLALERLSAIRAVLGDADGAAAWRARATRVRTAMQARLLDRASGLYRDGEGSPHHALHATAFPLACGLVPDALVPAALRFIAGKGMACSVYAAQWLLDGLYRTGAGDLALALLTGRGERSWLGMIDGLGCTIAAEAWSQRIKPNQDWNHAWGAAPANLIPRRLMGVRPLTPGCARLLIQPQPGGLPWARLTTPTIRGPVSVELTQEAGRAFAVSVEVPANASARVVLPRLGALHRRLEVDGAAVEGIEDSRGLAWEVGSGRHRLVRSA